MTTREEQILAVICKHGPISTKEIRLHITSTRGDLLDDLHRLRDHGLVRTQTLPIPRLWEKSEKVTISPHRDLLLATDRWPFIRKVEVP